MMSGSEDDVIHLFTRYYQKKATSAEIDRLFTLLHDLDNDDLITELMQKEWQNLEVDQEPVLSKQRSNEILDLILSHAQPHHIATKGTPSIWRKLAMAASVLILLSIGLFFWFKDERQFKTAIVKKPHSADITPGGNKAFITLSNGSVIVLDTASNGMLANLGNVKVKKTRDGQLIFSIDAVSGERSDKISYNTISTPHGGQYQIILPDGTQVWLNSKSSLTFPTVFAGNQRKVEMTGEVYFEVAKNAAKPFIVKSGNEEIEVLGTHFNVMAYDDEESQRTTLLEGSVKVSSDSEMKFLKPGQQAALNKAGQVDINNAVDIDRIVAWKNGYFDFKNKDIQTIMRQAARWYDVNVSYTGSDSHILYTGRIPRDVNFSELLSMLNYTGLSYEMHDNNIEIDL